MKTLLCVDTASFALHFALYEADSKRLLFQHQAFISQQWTHSALLVPLLKNALQEAQSNLQDLSAICVNIGPGSFTGLRASLSMVRVLGQFLPNLKIFAVNGFQMHLARLLDESREGLPFQNVVIALDARRQQQYMAYFTQQDSGGWQAQVQGLFSDESVFAQLKQDTLYYADTACLARYSGASPTHLIEPIFMDSRMEGFQGKTNGFEGVYTKVHNRKTACFNTESTHYGIHENRFLAAENAKMTEALWRAVILFDIEAVAWQDLEALYLQDPHITPNPNPPKAFSLGG